MFWNWTVSDGCSGPWDQIIAFQGLSKNDLFTCYGMLDGCRLAAETGDEQGNLIDIRPIGRPDTQPGTGISPSLLQISDDLVLGFQKRIAETVEDFIGHNRWNVLATGEDLPSIRVDDH